MTFKTMIVCYAIDIQLFGTLTFIMSLRNITASHWSVIVTLLLRRHKEVRLGHRVCCELHDYCYYYYLLAYTLLVDIFNWICPGDLLICCYGMILRVILCVAELQLEHLRHLTLVFHIA